MAQTKESDSLNTMNLRTKTGGAYIPPAKLRLMQQQISDKNSEAYQRLAWEGLKKGITGLINKVNTSNIQIIVRDLFGHNLIRGTGLFVRAIMKAQALSPTFTHVYAALVAVVNTKIPKIGELLLKRLVVQFRRTFVRNDKSACINTSRFIAHLVNQNVAYEAIALEILTLLLDNATNDSVEVSIAFLKEAGQRLDEVSGRAMNAIIETLRNILHEGDIDKRVQVMIEVLYAIRKDKFKEHPAVIEELDLVDEEDQITHSISMLDDHDLEDRLNVFKLDPDFQTNESKYELIKKDIIEANSDDDDNEDNSSGSGSDSDSESEEENEAAAGERQTIVDNTETNLILLRKTIYLTIQSSLDFEECAHKLMKLDLKPPQYPELCNMIVDCCAQQRTYIKFFGLLAQRFCQVNQEFVEPFKSIFVNCYETIHRFETCKLRNVAKLFGHLLYTDAIPWTVLECIKLNENETTSSSRVFIKILFQELAESFGLVKLNEKFKDPNLLDSFEGIFPKDNPQNTRFSINFFTSIGLGGLTEDLREHLKVVNSQVSLGQLINVKKEETSSSSSSSSSSSTSSSSDSSNSSSSSESESSTSEEEGEIRKRKRNKKKQKGHKDKREHKSNRKISPRREDKHRRDKGEIKTNCSTLFTFYFD